MNSSSLLRFSRALCLLALPFGTANAETLFSFRNTVHGIDTMSSGAITTNGLTMQLSAGPSTASALFREFNSGLGVVSRGTPGINDPSLDTFNVLSDSSGNPIEGETMTFSFDKAGTLRELDFDGVKDEAYEYFVLQTTTSPDLYFFDSFINTMGGDPSFINVPGQVVFLQEGTSAIDDKTLPLNIPFAAGQEFVLTYGQLNTAQPGQEIGNGARLQGITVVPEPPALFTVLAMLAGIALLQQRTTAKSKT